MTTPPDPPRSFNPRQYGHTQPGQAPPPQRPQFQTGPQQPVPPQQEPPPPRVRRRGFFRSLLDTRFDAMVTPMLIRGFYMLSLLVISLLSAVLFLFIWGLGGTDEYGDAPAWPFITAVIVTPIFWTFQVVFVRLVLEFVINQFKITEELQKIRRNTGS